jgi:alcohol dehydrogenase class IV
MSVFWGEGSFEQLLHSLPSAAGKRVFLVTGKQSYSGSNASRSVSSLLQNLQVARFSEFSANVKFDEALDGCRRFDDFKADIILAVGGGSVIDMAKIISVGSSDRDKLLAIIKGEREPQLQSKLYCAPTTAGSGSEATHFAVVYIDGKKYSLASQKLLPHSVAVDPSLSASMSPYLTACTGFDALSQAIESYWARGATAASREFSRKAISLILPNIVEAVQRPGPEVRRQMAEGAYYAGQAINISKTTAPHAFSYFLTSKFSIPHGHAVALLLGCFFEINEKNTPAELYSLLGHSSASACCDFWFELMTSCALETDLWHLNIAPDCAAEFAASVNFERLNNNPVSLNQVDIVGLVDKLFLGKRR